MALKDWTSPSTTYELPGGGTVAVRGLSVDQVAALVREDRDTLVAAFDRLMARDDVKAVAAQVEADEGAEAPAVDLDYAHLATELLGQAPRLVAKLIAWAAREPEAIEQALQLPFPTQLELLVEIGRLTFEKTTPEAFLEAVITVARSANAGMTAARKSRG